MSLDANERAALSLMGLSTGDAFGDQFFRFAEQQEQLRSRLEITFPIYD